MERIIAPGRMAEFVNRCAAGSVFHIKKHKRVRSVLNTVDGSRFPGEMINNLASDKRRSFDVLGVFHTSVNAIEMPCYLRGF